MEDILDKIMRKMKETCVKYKTIIIFGIILSIIMYWIWYINQDEEIINISDYDMSTENVVKNEDIVVHIDGQVTVPGVYTLKDGDRLDKLIELAGGFTSEANIKDINLAQKLKDATKIYISKIGEDVENVQEMNGDKTNNMSQKININKATIEELQTLPGIGESTAKKIIEYIKQKGKFNTIEEIMEINGIGTSKYEKIKELIEV